MVELFPFQQEWLRIYQLSGTQRWGQGLALGSIVHSELWNNLEKLGWRGDSLIRAFNNIIRADEEYIRIVRATEQEKKNKKQKELDPEKTVNKIQGMAMSKTNG